MRLIDIRYGCLALGYKDPITVQEDGIVYLGPDDDRTYPPMEPILAKAEEIIAAQAIKKKEAEAKLLELGLTVEDLRVLGL